MKTPLIIAFALAFTYSAAAAPSFAQDFAPPDKTAGASMPSAAPASASVTATTSVAQKPISLVKAPQSAVPRAALPSSQGSLSPTVQGSKPSQIAQPLAQNQEPAGRALQASAQSSAGSDRQWFTPAGRTSRESDLSDFNSEIYYKNKLELSAEGSYLPFNVPFIFDPLVGSPFARPNKQITNYVLLPWILSLRWQLYDVKGPSLLRGNTEISFGTSFMPIIQGPETFYAALVVGPRYNFVQPNWRVVPYFDMRGGFGWTDAKEPREYRLRQPGVGQGQDFTFNFIMGTGLEYNFSPAYSISGGVSYLHISNMYLSEPKYPNHGINLVGPNMAFYFRLECPGWVCRKD